MIFENSFFEESKNGGGTLAALTKRAIYASFLKFLNERPLDKITVKDIVDDCKINRKTFYYYFSDIYAMAEEMFREEFEKRRSEIKPDEGSWLEAFKNACSYMYERRTVALHVFRSLGFEKTNETFFSIAMEHIPLFLKNQAQGLSVSEEDVRLISVWAANSLSGMLTRWLGDGMKEIPEKLLDRFAAIMKGTLRLALENAAALNLDTAK